MIRQFLQSTCLACLCLSSLAVAVEEQGNFAVKLPLEVHGDGPWYRVELPMSLYFSARHADLRDLRVFNGEGESLAYSLVRTAAQDQRQQKEHKVRWFPLKGPSDARKSIFEVRVERGTNGTVVQLHDAAASPDSVLRGWLLDGSGIDAPLEKLTLDWDSTTEGFQRFSMEASDDLVHWRSWGEGQVTRLSFESEKIDQRDIRLPGDRGRYLRLLWLEPGQVPQLTAASLQSAVYNSRPAPMVWSESLKPSGAKDGSYRWELPLGLPIERVRVAIDQPNTLLPVQLQGRFEEKAPWQTLVSGVLYRLPQNRREVVQDELELPGWQALRQLRLNVDSRSGGFGKQTPGLQVGMHATELVFLVRGTPPFTLAVGNPVAKAVEMPLATLVPNFSDEKFASMGRAELGAGIVQSPVQSSSTPESDGRWRRFGLWAVLLLGVGLLGLMAVSLLRNKPKANS